MAGAEAKGGYGDGWVAETALFAAADGCLGTDGRVPGADVLDDEKFLQRSYVFVEGAAGEGVIIGDDIGFK